MKRQRESKERESEKRESKERVNREREREKLILGVPWLSQG